MKPARAALITPADIRRAVREGRIGPGSPLVELANQKRTRGHGASETEHRGQRLFFEKIKKDCPEDSPLHDAYAIPNAAKSKLDNARKKAEGQKPGMPDVCIPHARGQYHACYLEGKIVGQRVAPSQKAVHARLRAAGNFVLVVYGHDSDELAQNYWDEAHTYLYGDSDG